MELLDKPATPATANSTAQSHSFQDCGLTSLPRRGIETERTPLMQKFGTGERRYDGLGAGSCCLTFDMSGGPKGAKQPLERPLDGNAKGLPTFGQRRRCAKIGGV